MANKFRIIGYLRFSFIIIYALSLLMPAGAAFADDGSTADATQPPVVSVEETSEPDVQPQESEVTAAPDEVLSSLPEGTDLVVLDENQNPLPLASQDASSTLIQGDPMFCPLGVSFNDPLCIHTLSISEALQVARDFGSDASGTIYVENNYVDNSEIIFNEDFFTADNDAMVNLTVLGGIDFSTGHVVGKSTLNNRIRISNFTNPTGTYTGGLFLNNFIINETGGFSAVTIDNSDNVILNDLQINEIGDGNAVTVINSSDSFILENSVISEAGNGNAIQVADSLKPIVRNSVLSQSEAGSIIRFVSASQPTISGNIINSSNSSDSAVFIQNGNALNLDNNQINIYDPTGNGTTIDLIDVAGSNKITANILQQFGIITNGTFYDGLHLQGDALTDVEVTDNVFIGAGSSYSINNDAVTILRDQGNGNIPVSAELQFHDNLFINWSQSFFHNQVTNLTVHAEGNYYGVDDSASIYNHVLDAHNYGWAGYGPVIVSDNQVSTDDPDDDGITLSSDNFPFISNPGQGDNDGDGIGNACDLDDDGDMVLDVIDNCAVTPNPDQADADHDGIGDSCDTCLDIDHDGVCDNVDNCPLVANANQANNDGDTQGDVCDLDDDNDTVADSVDNCQFTANPSQTDNDYDGVGDACDTDDDNDTVADGVDNCQFIANTNQADNDQDADGDVCDSDDDNDTVFDQTDNCQFTPNLDQADHEKDGIGDVCDSDDDNDGISDIIDNCPLTYNRDQRDFNRNGIGDKCENIPAPTDDEGVIPVTGGDTVPLSCTGPSILELENGDRVVFDKIMCGYDVQLQHVPSEALPGQLPTGKSYGSGLVITIFYQGQVVEALPENTMLTIEFVIPETMSKQSLDIMSWDDTGKWNSLLTKVNKINNRLIVTVETTGTFLMWGW